MKDAFCVRVELHRISNNQRFIRGMRRHFYFLVSPEQTVADMGSAFLRAWLGDIVDADFPFGAWILNNATPFSSSKKAKYFSA
jgi:hypothetical protein